VAGDAQSGVVGQHALQPQAHLRRAVGDDHLPRVQRVADPDTSAVVEGDPRRPAGDVQQRVEDRPVGDRIAAVEHPLGLAEGRGDAAGVEMVAADGDRRRQLAARDEVVQRDPEFRPRALPQPADPRGQSLEVHLLASQRDPAAELRVVGEELEHQLVGAVDVTGVARQRHPAERPLSLAEEGTHVLGHESRNRERVGHARVVRDRSNVVAVVEGHGTRPQEGEHGAHVLHDRRRGPRDVLGRRGLAQLRGVGRAQAGGDVAVQRVVRTRLVGDDVGGEAAADELGEHLGRVPDESHGERAPFLTRREHKSERFVDGVGLGVAIPGREPLVDARLVHLHGEHRRAVHGRGQRLGTTHPPEARRQYDSAGERAAEVSPRDRAERLVRALQDALRADVDPRSGGHLPVHRQAGALQRPEGIPGRPASHQVAVGDEHARSPGVGPEHGHRLAALNE
jgi:hypothetical protein